MNQEKCHVYRFVRREAVTKLKIHNGFADQAPQAGDVVLVCKLYMCSEELASEPQVLLPAAYLHVVGTNRPEPITSIKIKDEDAKAYRSERVKINVGLAPITRKKLLCHHPPMCGLLVFSLLLMATFNLRHFAKQKENHEVLSLLLCVDCL